MIPLKVTFLNCVTGFRGAFACLLGPGERSLAGKDHADPLFVGRVMAPSEADGTKVILENTIDQASSVRYL